MIFMKFLMKMSYKLLVGNDKVILKHNIFLNDFPDLILFNFK